MSGLDIFIDVFSAPSYLALGPVIKLCRDLGVTPVWHPFRAPAERRPPPTADADVRQRHQRVRQAYRDHDHARYAAWQGLAFHPPQPVADRDAIDYAILRLGATTAAMTFLPALTARLWGGKDGCPDPDGLERLTGLEGFAAQFATSGRQALADERARTRPLGIFDAPAFVVAGELFIGRQHLPALRHLLTGGSPFDAATTTSHRDHASGEKQR